MGKKLTIDDCHALAEAKGGKFLSINFTTTKKEYLWECSKGHVWKAIFGNVFYRGTWCMECCGRKKRCMEDLKRFATEKSGGCNSSLFTGMLKKYEWFCEKGHIWKATGSNVVNLGHWCPVCSRQEPHNLAYLKDIAIKKGGLCLSSEYNGMKSRYLWQCSEGHKWETSANNIANNKTWCSICVGTKKKTIGLLQELAAKKEGKCLSTEYTNINNKYLWECSKGHQWRTTASSVFSKSWCPQCVDYGQGQRDLAEFCKTINSNFIENARPFNGTKLELDIYYPELKKAIELDGDYWHNMPKALERDSRKNHLCVDNNIQLLRLDYDKHWYKNKKKIGQQMISEFLGQTNGQ